MNLVSTTVVRQAPVSAGGFVRITEWPSGRRIAERPVVPDDPPVLDPNPRGNSRGGRGVVVFDTAILVASYHTLEVCDSQLRRLTTISAGTFAGIHEVTRRGERLFVACTAINAAAELPMQAVRVAAVADGIATPPRMWWPTEDTSLCETLGVPLTSYPDKDADHRLRHLDLHNRGKPGHLHLNAVDTDGEQVYALLNKSGALVRLADMQVVLRHPLLEGAHNLVFIAPGRAWVVGTKAGLLVECDLARGDVRPLVDLNATPFARGLASSSTDASSRPLFWRGLAISEDQVFIGTSPAAILAFNRKALRYQGVSCLSDNVREIIHGLAILP